MKRQDGTDVGVLELDGPLQSVPDETPQPLVVLRLVDCEAGQLVAQHREVVCDGRLDFIPRPSLLAGRHLRAARFFRPIVNRLEEFTRRFHRCTEAAIVARGPLKCVLDLQMR